MTRFLLCFYLVISCAYVVATEPAKIYWDESATWQQASTQIRVNWPESISRVRDWAALEQVGHITISDSDSERYEYIPLNFNATDENVALVLLAEGKGAVKFYAREKNRLDGPRLLIDRKKMLEVAMDVSIDKSSRKTLGGSSELVLSSSNPIFLQFQNVDIQAKNIELALKTTSKQFGDTEVKVYLLNQKSTSVTPPQNGFAANYILDKGIENDSNVYWASDFDSQSMMARISEKYEDIYQHADNILNLHFVPQINLSLFSQQNDGRTVLAAFETNAHVGFNMEYQFEKHGFNEPEEAYFRYYLRFVAQSGISGGGKLAGFSGTYNRAGWGGRPNNGNNGWSARGAFFESSRLPGPLLPIGSYLYQMNTGVQYGEAIPWGTLGSALKPNTWYCIEQHLKLNTPGNPDGVLEAWINGSPVFKLTNLQFRSTNKLKIEKVWFNFYFGGVNKPKAPFRMFIDNIVIAKKYIGPVRLD